MTPDLDPEAAMAGALTTELYREVEAMNCENFIVRMQLEAVERFQQRESWERLTVSDVEVLQSEVAGLPSEIEIDDIESRLFDLTALKMQLALAEGDMGTLEQQRRRVVEIARLLEEKSTIPAVKAQLAYLASVQESAFWEGIALNGLEELRLRLRGLIALPGQEDAHGRLYRLPRRDHGRARGRRRRPTKDDRGPVREEGAGVPEEPSRSHCDSSSPNQPAAYGHRSAGARADAGRDRRG